MSGLWESLNPRLTGGGQYARYGGQHRRYIHHHYYTKIVEHRRRMIFKTGVNYDTHYPATINFIPPDGIIAAFESDYAFMREQMIYGENRKDFTAIIGRLKQLLEKFRLLQVRN